MDAETALMLGDIELIKYYIKQGIDFNSQLSKTYYQGESW